MRPVKQLPWWLKAMKRSPLASSRNPDNPPNPGNDEVRTSPLRYSSEPKRTRAWALESKKGIGGALTLVGRGARAAAENSPGMAGFGGGCGVSCPCAKCGIAADKIPGAVDLRS